MPGRRSRFRYYGVCAALAAVVLLTFGRAATFDYINLDDDSYVFANRQILKGLTWENVVGAFTRSHADLWHPLATLTHLLDVELYGERPGGHHLTSVVLHAVAAAWLFLALDRLSGASWRSAATAAIFALHPLRVESVVWICERKDVLSGVGLAAVLWFYARYVERPSRGRYATLLGVFALGAMTKPMFVTVPAVLLLIDYWPLGRFAASAGTASARSWRRLLSEKVPLLVMSLGVAAATVAVQRDAMESLQAVSLADRLTNAACSYVIYLRQFIWPVGLAVFYPHRLGSIPTWEIVGAAAILGAITAAAVVLRRKVPYLIVGWFWYLGMTVPVSGILQAGRQAHADRFTYLPQIGIAIIAAWGIGDLFASWNLRPRIRFAAVAALLSVWAALAWRQASYWTDSLTLFARTLESAGSSELIHNNFGNALAEVGRYEESAEQFKLALAINPNYAAAWANLGESLLQLGRIDDSIAALRRSLRFAPTDAVVIDRLGFVLDQAGRTEEALEAWRRAEVVDPSAASPRINLGVLLAREGRLDDALAKYREASALDPSSAIVHTNTALVLYRQRKFAAATASFRESLRLQPDHVETLRYAAWVAATAEPATPDLADQAVRWAARAVELTQRNDPVMLDVLAASLASAGRSEEAVKVAAAAAAVATAQNRGDILQAIRLHAERYRAGLPWIEPPPP